ncbi:MAG: 3-methyl-2-oxobutanoate hydroxymethyltransferase [Candidatus Schekmanbacteria bacterium]|nr:3-methyl-2-oxobutanoate hydroxymethyltransferase [Candidatus Schekmanbacteria bacterium]
MSHWRTDPGAGQPASAAPRQPVTVPQLQEWCDAGRRIAVLTAYDYPSARVLDAAGIDVLLVGDSVGMVVLGYDSTLPVTTEEMMHHTRAVRRGTQRALVIADMPFGSFQLGEMRAAETAVRFVKECGAHAVKIEGGTKAAPCIAAIAAAEVPVMAHVGLTPQSINLTGRYRVQGRTDDSVARVLEDAHAAEAAGAFAIVLECIPWRLAARITEELRIPTIGIGAGPHCDGQVLVMHDLVGYGVGELSPRFVKRYDSFSERLGEAAARFRADLDASSFPAREHCYELPAGELAAKYHLDHYVFPHSEEKQP